MLCISAFIFVAVTGIVILTESICGCVAAVARIAVIVLLSELIRGRFSELMFCESLRLKFGMCCFCFLIVCCSRGCGMRFCVGGGLLLRVDLDLGLDWCFCVFETEGVGVTAKKDAVGERCQE